jgi:hypothetical protein
LPRKNSGTYFVTRNSYNFFYVDDKFALSTTIFEAVWHCCIGLHVKLAKLKKISTKKYANIGCRIRVISLAWRPARIKALYIQGYSFLRLPKAVSERSMARWQGAAGALRRRTASSGAAVPCLGGDAPPAAVVRRTAPSAPLPRQELRQR